MKIHKKPLFTCVPSSYRMILALLTSLIICLMHVSGCSSSEDGAPIIPAGTGSIEGLVTHSDGQVYAGIRVNLMQGGVFKVRSSTDGDGAFKFSDLTLGTYEVIVIPPLSAVINGSDTKSVSVTDGKAAQADFIFEMVPVEAALVYGETDIFGELRNAEDNIPVDDNELVYSRNAFEEPIGELHPIKAPDGHHITLGEWRTAQGSATATCDGNTSKYSLTFTGLIPNGVYTVWHLILDKSKESNQSINISNEVTGMGALGGEDGRNNFFTASSTGEGQLTVEASPGSMTLFGANPSCPIVSSPGFFLSLAYHLDGKTHGIRPGPDKDDIGHLHLFWN